ncbi:DUF4367 domain-containing protein [Blautia obeum]|uniref:DUF4367 domain-containing protein n=1 Tax=Blautia obeum TaxID=40520 RepID=UPI0035639D85
MKKEFENNKKNALGNNPDLRDDIDDEIFQKILREEFIEREKQIEEALFADKDVEDLVFTDEEVKDSYQELLRRFEREKRENAEHEASDSKIIEIKSRKTGVRWHQLGKAVGMAAVALACIFAASMTSEANRKYLVNSMRIWSGDDTKTVNYNDDSNENANLDEDKAIVDIEEKLGIEMPRFYYRPQGMQFENYEVEELLEVARIEYKYNDSVIILYIDKQNESSESKMNSRHGDESGTVVVNEEGTQVSISEIEDIDEKACYSAEWTKDSVMYCLSGRMDIKDLKKIIKEMKF